MNIAYFNKINQCLRTLLHVKMPFPFIVDWWKSYVSNIFRNNEATLWVSSNLFINTTCSYMHNQLQVFIKQNFCADLTEVKLIRCSIKEDMHMQTVLLDYKTTKVNCSGQLIKILRLIFVDCQSREKSNIGTKSRRVDNSNSNLLKYLENPILRNHKN